MVVKVKCVKAPQYQIVVVEVGWFRWLLDLSGHPILTPPRELVLNNGDHW